MPKAEAITQKHLDFDDCRPYPNNAFCSSFARGSFKAVEVEGKYGGSFALGLQMKVRI